MSATTYTENAHCILSQPQEDVLESLGLGRDCKSGRAKAVLGFGNEMLNGFVTAKALLDALMDTGPSPKA